VTIEELTGVLTPYDALVPKSISELAGTFVAHATWNPDVVALLAITLEIVTVF
jgi:hypothetical protein